MSTSSGSDSDATTPSQDPAQFSPVEAHYWELIDILPVGIFTIDASKRIEAMNHAAADLIGVEPGATRGRTCEEVLRCSFCGPTCAVCQSLTEEKVSRAFPVEIQQASGERKAVLIDAVPLPEDHVAVLIRDVSDAGRLLCALKDRWVFHGLVCVSEPMKAIVGEIRELAPYDSIVLLLGESGTGKQLVARAIHAESPRASRPFVVVNCAAYSETLLEAELFGHARGAFAGADRDREGRFEMAEGGTILLEEIASIPPKIQVKLLKVLQQHEIERMGESRARPVNARVLASTDRDLHKEVREGRFREDLYYRLNVVTLRLPPLRDRKEDIPPLADYLLERLAERTGKQVAGSSNEVMRSLLNHPWPGNVRELENVLESALVRARGDTVTAIDLPNDAGSPRAAAPDERMREALRRTAGCVTRAARLLGMHRTTLWRHMRETGITREEFLEG
jgi:transcriptional regulator with PAS, ATPase and Fis domain